MAECRFCSGSGYSTCRNTGREGLIYQVGALLDFRSSDIELDGLLAAHLRAGGYLVPGLPVQSLSHNKNLALFLLGPLAGRSFSLAIHWAAFVFYAWGR